MDNTMKARIDSMTYAEMLRRWRYAPDNDPMFMDESGQYFKQVMGEKCNVLTDDQRVAVSKKVGLD